VYLLTSWDRNKILHQKNLATYYLKLIPISQVITNLDVFARQNSIRIKLPINKTIIGNILEPTFPSSCFHQNGQPICTNFMMECI